MKRTISILGSTGSIGLTTLKIIDKKKIFFKVFLLSADKNYKLIIKQIKKYKPEYFVINNYSVFLKIKNKKYKNCKIVNKLEEVIFKKANDLTICAIPGIAGLKPTIELIKYSKKIFLANKESIVCGWNVIKKIAKKNNTKIIPIDSEHFSISKLLLKHNIEDIKKIYITASGGPFLNRSIKKFKNIRPSDATKHPKWKMGKKISVDSSTMVNKILELIEAQKLFEIPDKKIDIIIHPNSLVHALVELKNGLFESIYHETSMVIPIANAIFDGKLNIEDFYVKKNSIFKENLVFKNVDKKRFPIIKIRKFINKFPSTPIILNASNEILVDQFLKKKIPFLAITKIIMSILRDRNYRQNAIVIPKNLNQIIKLDYWARKKTFSIIQKLYA